MNGYIMIDCKGLNLLAQESQTINGLFADCMAAIELGKPVYATNCVYGDGVPMTPISVMGIVEDNTIIWTASILQVRVNASDGVTIVPLITPNNTRKSK